MRWTPGKISSNIEDKRGSSGGIGRAGMGLGTGAVLLVLSLVFGHNFFNDVAPAGTDTSISTNAAANAPPASETPEEHQRVLFVSFVLDDVQSNWAKIFANSGQQYHDAKLVLFRNAVQSGCGVAQSAMGPFYCPADQKVYIDLGFYDELTSRFGAPGDFAQAYVLAHELGHHIQHQLGTDARVRQLEESRPGQSNNLSVRLELQADCFAGVWANTTEQRKLLNEGDITEAITAASAVGDDRIQQEETGNIHPESFTHGTAAQRASWFKRGYTSGQPGSCDTFAGAI
ncbi:MAG: neutral zinc metallopeptidase [Gemmatimonadaceae bacterium]